MRVIRPDKLRTMKQTIKRIHYATAFYSESPVDAVEFYEEGLDNPTIVSSKITTAGPFNSAAGSRNIVVLHGIVKNLETLTADSALLVQKENRTIVYNGDFQSTDPWTISSVPGWYSSTAGTSSVDLSTTEFHSGTQSMRIHIDDDGSAAVASASMFSDSNNIIQLEPEGMYSLSFWHKSTADSVMQLVMTMQQADGTTVYLQADGSWGASPNIAVATTTDWSLFTINFQAQDRVRLMQSPVNDLSLTAGVGSEGVDFFIDEFEIVPQTNGESDLAYYDQFITHRGRVSGVEYDEDQPTTTLTIDDAIVIAGASVYGGLALTYPIDIEGLIQAVSEAVVKEDAYVYSPSLPNLDVTLESDAFANIQGYMVRDFISDLAETTGTFARINASGSLEFSAVDMTPVDTLDHSTMSKLKVIADTGIINQLSLSRQPQDDNIVETDEDSAALNGVKTYRIVNNWIMDGARETFITPLFENVFNGISYYTGQIETIGLCFFDVGDVITADNGGDTYNMLITEINLAFENGGIKETLISKQFDDGTTNQLTAGNVLTTLYNTKIQVDHQNNEITSLVAEYTSFADATSTQFTEIVQTLNNITSTIQSTGGGNLIQNSVGFAEEGDSLTRWEESGVGEVTNQDSPASLAFGAVSGHSISVNGASKKLTQRVPVTLDAVYSFSFYANKGLTGNAYIRLKNSVDNYEFELLSGTIYPWEFFYIENITSSDVYFDVEIESDGAVDLSVTDMILIVGPYRQVWSQYNGEILNTSVQIDTRGIRVYSDTNVGSYTMMTPSEFASYDDQNRVAFRANNDTIEVNNFTSTGDTYYPEAKIFVRQGTDGLSYFVRDPNV